MDIVIAIVAGWTALALPVAFVIGRGAAIADKIEGTQG